MSSSPALATQQVQVQSGLQHPVTESQKRGRQRNASWLSALTALVEDPESIPGIHMVAHKHVSPVPENSTPFSGLSGHQALTSAQTQKQAKHLHI